MRKIIDLLKSKPLYIVLLYALFILIVLFPIYIKVNFSQNDDWLYYNLVTSFSKGNLTLDTKLAPIFLLQGMLGVVWSLMFGSTSLTIMTLAFSCLNFVIFFHIVHLYFKKSFYLSLLSGLILFFNPLHIYSSIGFMTENYYLFFNLISLLFIYKFFETYEKRSFVLSNIFIILSFFIRQLALVTSLSFGLALLLKKKYRYGFTQLGIFASLVGYYYLLFPRTGEMRSKGLNISNLSHTDYVYSLIYSIFIYLCAFSIPYVFSFIFEKYSSFISTYKASRLKLIISACVLIFISAIAFLLLNDNFQPSNLAWSEFYYLENTLERTGFYPRGFEGTKYQFKFIYDLYNYWDSISKYLVTGLILSVLVAVTKKSKQLLNFESVYILIYISLLVITAKIFDRYVLMLVPVFILWLLRNTLKETILSRILCFGFLLFVAFYSYQFCMDFILLNSYVWSKSGDISTYQHVSKGAVFGTKSWNQNYRLSGETSEFFFTYDSPERNPELNCCWELIEQKIIKFPLNLFINPTIYLYKRL